MFSIILGAVFYKKIFLDVLFSEDKSDVSGELRYLVYLAVILVINTVCKGSFPFMTTSLVVITRTIFYAFYSCSLALSLKTALLVRFFYGL